jgi:heme/copper-type cytochrome/quinol oxidase subunit 2
MLVVLAGVMMVTVGIKLTGLMPRLEQLALPASLARLVGLDRASGGRYSHGRTAVTGMLTFFLPCAFTQTMQVLAVSTGSFLQGAAVMAAFAIGTAPGLLVAGSAAGFAKGNTGRMFLKVAGIAVLLLGIWNMGNGWNLTGITLGNGTSAAIGTAAAQLPPIREGAQVLQMNQWAGGYNPNKLTVRAGMPVRWEISADGTGCSSYMVVPSLGIKKTLQPGMNVVEFTPKRAGTIKFSCGMGMFTGSIAVMK